MANKEKYPFIRVWNRMMGSHDYYIKLQKEKAEEDKAPQTAIYKNDHEARWHDIHEVKGQSAREYFIERHSELLEEYNVEWRKTVGE